MDPIDSAINNLFIRFMLLGSYDASDDQIKYLFEKIIELPCQEHGPGCFSNMISLKLNDETKLSLKEKFKQLSEGFKTSDSACKLSMIENISDEIKPLIDYKSESKCIIHIVANKILFKSKSMVNGETTSPGLNILSMFSSLSNSTQQTPNIGEEIKAPSLVKRTRFKPVYEE